MAKFNMVHPKNASIKGQNKEIKNHVHPVVTHLKWRGGWYVALVELGIIIGLVWSRYH